MAKKPKIDEVINSLSEMSKIFYQIIILSDCLDRLIETETTVEKVKLNVKSFITDLERCVKDFTKYEMVLTTYLQGSNPEEIRELYDFGSIATIYLM